MGFLGRLPNYVGAIFDGGCFIAIVVWWIWLDGRALHTILVEWRDLALGWRVSIFLVETALPIRVCIADDFFPPVLERRRLGWFQDGLETWCDMHWMLLGINASGVCRRNGQRRVHGAVCARYGVGKISNHRREDHSSARHRIGCCWDLSFGFRFY